MMSKNCWIRLIDNLIEQLKQNVTEVSDTNFEYPRILYYAVASENHMTALI